MIPDPVLMLLAVAVVWCVVACIVIWFTDLLERRGSLRRCAERCAERRVLAEIEMATMLALKAAPEKSVSELTKKIVPLRPDSA